MQRLSTKVSTITGVLALLVLSLVPLVGSASASATALKPTAAAALSPTAGVLTATATTSRQLQFALKFLF